MNFTFNWLDEAAVIHYTTDGSTPTLSSTTYNNQRARSVGEVLTLSTPGKHTIKWFAVDIKGNQSAVQTKTISVGETVDGPVGGTVPATLSLTLGAPATFGAFTPGVAKEYTATTEATVISTAGDATLTVADPSAVVHRPPGQRRVLPAAAAAGSGRREDVDGTDLQREGAGHVQAGHRRQRRAPHRRVQQDAHVHAEHDHPVVQRSR